MEILPRPRAFRIVYEVQLYYRYCMLSNHARVKVNDLDKLGYISC
jgi:hypothetical protein